MRHAVQPRAEPVRLPQRPGLAGEEQEGGLEGVLGVVRVAEHLTADAQDQGPMPLQERDKGRLVPLRDELLQQAAVALLVRSRRTGQVAEIAKNARQRLTCHEPSPRRPSFLY